MSIYRYFTEEELSCSHCGKSHMDELFMEKIVALREDLGFGFPVTSSYRCTEHPVEARKSSPGAHNTGKAMDIQVSGKRAMLLLEGALRHGFIGIGVNQKGPHDQRFLHLDLWLDGPRPSVWSY